MPKSFMKAAALLSVTTHIKSQCARVQFRDATNQSYAIDFPEAVLGSLTVALMSVANQMNPSGYGQMLNVTAGRLFELDDNRSGLELTLEGSLRLPLIFSKTALGELRKTLDELESRATKDPGGSQTSH